MLLFPAGLLGQQLLLLAAQDSGGVEVLGVDRYPRTRGHPNA
jgi:hypothetical protein